MRAGARGAPARTYLRLPIPSDPSSEAPSSDAPSAAASARAGIVGSSRKSALGTKNSPPVTAVEKSRIRSWLPGGLADEHVGQHLLDDVRRAGVADEVRPELAGADSAEGHVVAHDLALLAVVVDDRVQRDVRVGGLDVVRQLDVAELLAADDPLLLLDRAARPTPTGRAGTSGRRRSCRRRSRGPRRRSTTAAAAAAPSGFSVPSTKPSRSRSSKDLNPCTSSTTRARPRAGPSAAAPARSTGPGDGRRMWKSRSPGVLTAVCTAPANSGSGCRPAGRGSPKRRSQRSEPRPTTHVSPRLGDAESDRSPQPADVRQQVADLVLGARVHGEHEEDRRLGERRQNGLRLGVRHGVSLQPVTREGYPAEPRVSRAA